MYSQLWEIITEDNKHLRIDAFMKWLEKSKRYSRTYEVDCIELNRTPKEYVYRRMLSTMQSYIGRDIINNLKIVEKPNSRGIDYKVDFFIFDENEK